MCRDCWDARGRPSEWTPSIAAAVVLLDALESECPAGGYLHIVTDDYNVRDSDLASCWDLIERNPDPEWWTETLALQRSVHAALAKLTERERTAALAWRDGFNGERPQFLFTGADR